MNKGARTNRAWQLWSRGSGFRVKERSKRLEILPVRLRRATEARCVAGVSLCGGLERPLYEAMEVKPRFSWRPQNAEDVRTVRYLPRKSANREWNQLKRKKWVAINKDKRS